MKNNYLLCKLCVARDGIKGSALEEKGFLSEEHLFAHIEMAHGVYVIREGETEEQATFRCAAKGIVPDKTKCQCEDCRRKRGEVVNG